MPVTAAMKSVGFRCIADVLIAVFEERDSAESRALVYDVDAVF